uniref:Holocytochrome c-type synthase n=1 Tax=Salmo trutta TaxID=8032 RepID=A0A674BRV7_SALTR
AGSAHQNQAYEFVECPMKAEDREMCHFGVENQQHALGQPFDMSVCQIPWGGMGQNWVYPLEQMFWNAMVRKGNWLWGKSFKNIKIVNYRYPKNYLSSTLKYFYLSTLHIWLRARFRHWMGYGLPFDIRTSPFFDSLSVVWDRMRVAWGRWTSC